MKPAPFEYERAADLGWALAALARYGREAKVPAGGPSLVPVLNLRLAPEFHAASVMVLRPQEDPAASQLQLDGLWLSGEIGEK